MDLDEREQEEFGPVLANLRRDCLPKFASEVRHAKDSSLDMMECNVLPELQCGSYHVVLTLVFVDGISWVLKIPSKGKSGYWNDIMARGLESEANTMRLIRRETGIPVPEVHAFDSSLDSGLGCPFILMEKVPGRHLDCGWFDEEVSQAKRKSMHLLIVKCAGQRADQSELGRRQLSCTSSSRHSDGNGAAEWSKLR